MSEFENLRPNLGRLQTIGLVVGAVGLAIAVLGAFLNLQTFFQAYLFGYLFWFNLALGCLGLLLVQNVTGGRWGLLIRRMLEAGALTIPLLGLLFVPFLFGLPQLYAWARPEALNDEVYLTKAAYLNQPGYIIRAIIFFAIWSALAIAVTRLSRAQDTASNPAALSRRLRIVSAPGIVLYVITITLASTDWAMSLDFHWFSTIYGMYFMVSQGLTAFTFVIVVLAALSRQRPMAEMVRPPLFADLGTLTFAFVILWTYMSFAQYLIIWSANIAEEVTWYLRRAEGGWEYIAIVLMIFHFAVPFFLLLSRRIKRSAQLLTGVAAGLLIMRLIDLYWLIGPEFHASVLEVNWLAFATLAGIGGLWLAAFAWLLPRRPFLPIRDPALPMVLSGD
ncbi:MAG: hypothetical protein MUD01_13910 [Chloroflexaceae bacterium]|jgi:hypothetical protein|nr:hypothetical protein [Chloroflexaceae bacterium]